MAELFSRTYGLFSNFLFSQIPTWTTPQSDTASVITDRCIDAGSRLTSGTGDTKAVQEPESITADTRTRRLYLRQTKSSSALSPKYTSVASPNRSDASPARSIVEPTSQMEWSGDSYNDNKFVTSDNDTASVRSLIAYQVYAQEEEVQGIINRLKDIHVKYQAVFEEMLARFFDESVAESNEVEEMRKEGGDRESNMGDSLKVHEIKSSSRNASSTSLNTLPGKKVSHKLCNIQA